MVSRKRLLYHFFDNRVGLGRVFGAVQFVSLAVVEDRKGVNVF